MFKVSNRYAKRLAPAALAFALIAVLAPVTANAATPSPISVSPSNPTKSAASDALTITLSGYTNQTTKCLSTQYSVNADGTGGIATGATVSGTTLTGTLVSGFTTNDTNAATGTVVYSSAGGSVTGTGSKTLIVSSITNPSIASAFLTLKIYDNTGIAGNVCTGSVIDTVVLALAFTDNTVVSVTVDPTFTFAVTGGSTVCNGVGSGLITSTSTAVAFGHLAAGARAYGSQYFNVSSNAGNGYSVYLKSTAATANVMKGSGARVIPDSGAAATVPAAGTAFFGYTSNATGSGTTSGQIATVPYSGASAVVVGANAGAIAPDTTQCVGYAVGAASTTAADTYSSTMVYTAVPTF